MATDPNDLIDEVDDDILELTDPIDPPEGDEQDDEIVLEVEGEEEAEQHGDNTPLAKRLRQVIREKDDELKRLRPLAKPTAKELSPKPKLADFDYDEEAYDAARDKWDEEKRAFDNQATTEQETARRVAEEADRARVSYKARAAALPFKDFQPAEDAFVAVIPDAIQMATVKYLPDAEKVIYALGHRPAKLAEIAAIADPIAQLLAIKDFGSKIVMRPKTKPAPAPDRPQSGSGQISTSVDKEAERLLAAAMKPGGDMTAYNRHMRAKREKK